MKAWESERERRMVGMALNPYARTAEEIERSQRDGRWEAERVANAEVWAFLDRKMEACGCPGR